MAKKVDSSLFADPRALQQLEQATGMKFKFDPTTGFKRIPAKKRKRKAKSAQRGRFAQEVGAGAAKDVLSSGDLKARERAAINRARAKSSKQRGSRDETSFEAALSRPPGRDRAGRGKISGKKKQRIRERVRNRAVLTPEQKDEFNTQFRTGQRENQLFNPQAEQDMRDFIQNPLGMSEGELAGQDLIGGVPGQVDTSEQFFGDFTAPAAQELVETGMPVDTQALHEAALRGFTRETLPAALERLVGGAGLASSGAVDQLGGLARDLSAQLAGLDFGAAENAAARRAGSLSTVSDLFTRQIGNRGNAAAGLFDLGQAGRLGEESTRPGGRLFGASNILAGNSGAAVPFVQGFQPESQSLGTAGKVAAGIQGFSKALSPF